VDKPPVAPGEFAAADSARWRAVQLTTLLVVAVGILAPITLVFMARGRVRQRLKFMVAVALPIIVVLFYWHPPGAPMILLACHDGKLYALEPLKQVQAKVSFFGIANREYTELNWDGCWLAVNGCCYCGKPYAPPGTFVLALLPRGPAYCARASGQYDHMTRPRYIPIWAVLTASVLPLVWSCFPLFRRHRRRRQGLCIQCGYNLKGNVSGICPECGHAGREGGVQ
jgi:hypothetical protein